MQKVDAVKFWHKKNEFRTKEEYHQTLKERIFRVVIAGLTLVAAGSVVSAVVQKMVTVSNSVNGRELPVYCVETTKKQVALSFDAAWGNEDTRTILDILQKHNVQVTFFMTGGWGEEYTY